MIILKNLFCYQLAIDLNTINNLYKNGKRLSPAEVLHILRKTNTLFYDGSRGTPPMIIKKGWFKNPKLVNTGPQPEEDT